MISHRLVDNGKEVRVNGKKYRGGFSGEAIKEESNTETD
jgi:hypothetical protein